MAGIGIGLGAKVLMIITSEGGQRKSQMSQASHLWLLALVTGQKPELAERTQERWLRKKSVSFKRRAPTRNRPGEVAEGVGIGREIL